MKQYAADADNSADAADALLILLILIMLQEVWPDNGAEGEVIKR
jgi:hypothetical protein